MAAASDGSLFWRSSFCSRWRSNSIIKQAVRSRTTLSSPENANSKFWIIFISNPSRVRLRLLWISPLRELFGSGLRREKKRDRLVVVWRRWHLLNHSFLWRSARERGLVWHSGGVGEVERMQLFYKKKKSRFLTPWSGSPSLLLYWEEDVRSGSGWRLWSKTLQLGEAENVGKLWYNNYLWKSSFQPVWDVMNNWGWYCFVCLHLMINHIPFINVHVFSASYLYRRMFVCHGVIVCRFHRGEWHFSFFPLFLQSKSFSV